MLRTVLCAVAVCILALPSWAELSRAEFETAFVEAFETVYPDRELVWLAPFSFDVVEEGEDENDRINIDRAYDSYLTDPDNLDAVLDRWVSIFGDLETLEIQEIAENLVAMPRPYSYLDYLESMDAQARLPIHKPLIGDLVLILMVDSPEALRGALAEDIDGAGLSEEEAWNVAYENSGRLMGQTYRDIVEDGKIVLFASENSLIATLIADPAFCSSGHALAERVFILSDRDVIAASADGSAKARRAFWQMVDPLLQSGLLMSITPLACLDGNLIVAEHP